MLKQAFVGATIVTPFEQRTNATLLITGSQVEAVLDQYQWENQHRSRGQMVVHDVAGHWICPGLIDIHVHGAASHRFTDGAAAVAAIAEALPAQGITAFAATISTESLTTMEQTIKAITAFGQGGARCVGIHLEGPFINPVRRGAQKLEYILPPSVAQTALWLELAAGKIKIVSLAPEMPGAAAVISLLRSHGVVVAAGHSDGTFAAMGAAFRSGVSLVTHTFNGMRPFHHREPGLAGAALVSKDIDCELIGDGVHVHPGAMQVLLNAKGLERVVLVTDGCEFLGMPDGQYTKGDGRSVAVNNGRVTLSDGTLAGSASPMIQDVHTVKKTLGLSWPEVVRLATINPARILGCDHCLGSLVPGYAADFVVLDDVGEVSSTYVNGQQVYRRTI